MDVPNSPGISQYESTTSFRLIEEKVKNVKNEHWKRDTSTNRRLTLITPQIKTD